MRNTNGLYMPKDMLAIAEYAVAYSITNWHANSIFINYASQVTKSIIVFKQIKIVYGWHTLIREVSSAHDSLQSLPR